MEQLSIFDLDEKEAERVNSNALSVVKAQFVAGEKKTWVELFDGYDELYAITFSSGLGFVSSLVKKFEYAEIIFGCEQIMLNSLAAVMSVQTALIEQISKSKSAKELSERMDDNSLRLFASRSMKSHEKIFVLKAKDGRVRVITGSANMSKSAFEGYQRENINYFDDEDAFNWYMDVFEEFKEKCSDSISYKAVISTIEDDEYLRANPEEIPCVKSLDENKVFFLETDTEEDLEEIELVVNAKGLENDLKAMIPKPKKENGKLYYSRDDFPTIKRKSREVYAQKKDKVRKLPVLHLDYDNRALSFNGRAIDMAPEKEKIKSDLDCLNSFFASLEHFHGNSHGDYKQSQKDYFRFMNWSLSTVFIPYLRYIAKVNNYDVTTLPCFGILYGGSNGGKSTFVEYLTKMMTGRTIPKNGSGDFTYSTVNDLRRGIEGVPINFDDLDKTQFKTHSDKIIKEDDWGIAEHFINYPAVIISTNKLPVLEQAIAKRVVGIRIETRIGKEEGLNCSKTLKENYKKLSNNLFAEYVTRMLPRILELSEKMKAGGEKYPDIFAYSSKTLVEIYKEYSDEMPDYVRELSFSDYYGAKVTGQGAIQKIRDAWESERGAFTINRKTNTLIYSYPENGNIYELKYIYEDLPPELNAVLLSKSIKMDLKEAEKFFGTKFEKGFFEQLRDKKK